MDTDVWPVGAALAELWVRRVWTGSGHAALAEWLPEYFDGDIVLCCSAVPDLTSTTDRPPGADCWNFTETVNGRATVPAAC
jgi:hypothetical protein